MLKVMLHALRVVYTFPRSGHLQDVLSVSPVIDHPRFYSIAETHLRTAHSSVRFFFCGIYPVNRGGAMAGHKIGSLQIIET